MAVLGLCRGSMWWLASQEVPERHLQGGCGLKVRVCSLACEGALSAWVQPPMTQSCSESALVGLGASKGPAPTRPQAVVLAVAAPLKVDQKGMFVAGGPGQGGRQAGGQNVRDNGQVSLGGHFPPSGAGCVWPSPQLGASGTKSWGHTRVSHVSPPASVFFSMPHVAGLVCSFPRPPCAPGTLQSTVRSICVCLEHWDGYTANEEREAQRGAETYPSLHSSDKARTCLWGLGHCPMLPC